MKPPPVSYARTTRIEDALELLVRHGEEAKLLAGGQSLIPLLNFRMARPSVLIDINPIRSLDFIREGPGGTIEIGALTRQRDLERSPLVARSCPILAAAASRIGHAQIRNRGTVGGSIAHADPAAELPLALVGLEGEIAVRSPSGRRSIAASDFFTGLWETALRRDEILEAVRVPALPPAAGWSFDEVTHRAGDFAVAAAAVVLALDPSGRIERCVVALSGTGTRPVRLSGVEAALVGTAPSPDAFAEAGRRVATLGGFRSDVRADAGYRGRVAAYLVEEGLSRAAGRARGGGGRQ
ncbi:MAG TPA: xanthine dehydrogenase family protein subunit M [Actinomycetes bacterium]|nr:xanthine dehydrogenase family protein subunit M [Actinomycetes bacterium]